MQSDKKTTVLVWASVGAALAGIAVTAILFKCRNRLCADEISEGADHRHLQQVLSDCYSKIEEIEARLPSLGNGPTPVKSVRTGHVRSRASNGKPVLES